MKNTQASAVGNPQNKTKTKAPRYKFDDTWKAMLHRFEEIYGVEFEKEIRDYIETGKNYDDYFRDCAFECVWILLKAEIDRRKARNDRARERRRKHREAAEREKREAEEAALAAARREEEDRQAALETERRRRAEMRRNRNVQRRDSITTITKSTSQPTTTPTGSKPVFANRFRGPGLRNPQRPT